VNSGCRIWWELINARKGMGMSVSRNSEKNFSEVKEIIISVGMSSLIKVDSLNY
jgi:hypothetical protein